MKYGYLWYRKRLPRLRKERPINIGDPVQSIAVINLYKEMGIAAENIIPLDRYDLQNYEGEEAIVVVNGAEGYEHFAYHTHGVPPAPSLIPIYFSYYFSREMDEETKANFREYGPVGCRDNETAEYFRNNDIGAYVTGCVTMTFPKRTPSESQDKVIMIDCPGGLEEFIPQDLKEGALRLSSVIRFKSASPDDKMTQEETDEYHRLAQERIELLRDRAKLVITSRFHAAVPAIAMGIPVILAKSSFDGRFEILENILPLYTPDRFPYIDWNPDPVDMEESKKKIKNAFFSAVRFAEARKEMKNIYQEMRKPLKYDWAKRKAVAQLPFAKESAFRYAVWGVCLTLSHLICNEMQKQFPSSELYAAIDTYQAGEYMGKTLIQPDRIKDLPEDVVVLVLAPSAHSVAIELLKDTGRRFVLFKEEKPVCYNFQEVLI